MAVLMIETLVGGDAEEGGEERRGRRGRRWSEVCVYVRERGMEVRVREVRGMPAYLLLQSFLSLVQIPCHYSAHCW